MRVELVERASKFPEVPPGTRGKVLAVSEETGVLTVRWDTGIVRDLIPKVDNWKEVEES